MSHETAAQGFSHETAWILEPVPADHVVFLICFRVRSGHEDHSGV